MSDKKDDDSGLIDVRTIKSADDGDNVTETDISTGVSLNAEPLKVPIFRRPSRTLTTAIVTMIFVLVCSIVVLAAIFLSGNKTKKSGNGEETGSLSSGQILAERKRVAFNRMIHEKELNAIEEEHGRSQRQEELQRQDSGAVVIPNVQIKVASRIGENKLDLEVTMPNEERLLYVCEPVR